MKNLKKIILSIIMMILFVSCGNNNNDENVLRVGMEVGYAPFNWFQKDDSNDAVKTKLGYANGYDVQIAKIIANKLGKKLEIVQTDWDALLGPALTSNKVDLVIAGVSPTNERKKSIDFTDSYYKSDLVIVIKKNSPFVNAKSINDFKNAKITGQLNSIHYSVIDQMQGVDKQAPLDNFPVMLAALNSGRIDGYVAEKPSALSASFADDSITYVEFSEENGFKYSHDEIDVAIGVKKENTELKEKVNEILKGISVEERDELMSKAIKTQPLAE